MSRHSMGYSHLYRFRSVPYLAGDHAAAQRLWERVSCEYLAAHLEHIDIDALDTTDPATRRGHGRHHPHQMGVHVATIAHRIDIELDSDPIVQALRAHVAA